MRKLSLIKIKLQLQDQAHNRCTENNHIQVFLEDLSFYECYTILNGKQLLMFLQNTGSYTNHHCENITSCRAILCYIH